MLVLPNQPKTLLLVQYKTRKFSSSVVMVDDVEFQSRVIIGQTPFDMHQHQ